MEMTATTMRLIPNFDMPPSCRTIWTSPEAQQIWEPRVALASRAYWKLERETVKAGIRRCTTTHVNPDRMADEMRDLAKDGLTFLPRLKVGSYNGFAHRHPPVEPGKPWNWYGPIGSSVESARAFVEAEEQSDHRAIGDLLGYPKCCQEFFSTVWMAGYVDPVWQAAERTDADYFKMRTGNVAELSGPGMHMTWSGSRYNGLRLAAHIPCSYSCESTRRMSSLWIQLGRDLGVPGIEELIDLLNMPTEWNALHGIAWVTTPIYRVVTNTVACTEKFVVRKHGEFIPKEAARGLTFPFLNK